MDSATRAPASLHGVSAPGPALITILIDRIGAEGDGVATGPDGKPVHVARTLPAEQVTAAPQTRTRALLHTILTPSPQRVQAPCPLFATCGGCALQHWEDPAYAAWKTGLVTAALRHAGFPDAPTAPLQRTGLHARRRMDLAILREPGRILIGLHAQHSQEVVDLTHCEILHPTLFALLAPLRAVLNSLAGLRRRGGLLANLLPTGPDLLIRADAPASAADRTRLAAFARDHGITRIAWAAGNAAPELAASLAAPGVDFAGVCVEPPPGAFLQASEAGEAAIVAAVLAGLPDKLTARARVIELYAGIGTLSFPLATRASVQAYEGDAAAAASLRRAAGSTRVTAHHRDLARQPLQAGEFAGAAAVVLDPPFAGAAAQMANLAAAGVPRVIYVSCNTAALARDAAGLHAAGYRLVSVTPVDQFLWSAQVEAVAVFTRETRRGPASRAPARPGHGASAIA